VDILHTSRIPLPQPTPVKTPLRFSLAPALATGALLWMCYFPLAWGWLGWVALVPLLWFCRDRSLMGGLVNRRSTTVLATAIAVLIIGLNVFLLEQTLL